ncbi:SIS domain-containing protein [Carbonactinospora thermoautotrophica]|uniref:Phosphoheptose isomerase n=2 Tax=Carbonactinospora thermoautotrophica TaxID=1469144 RepID=A0A132MZ74_9ACTN|nr:SIS domain-containing protein [Carbonactinospora thermoautotrophica]KWX03107.1 Phosphoheptose isomerase [Carbonactinospora thermoautotrophica]MCX9193297.1 SIS domain-containing protein [Carbonactinospora thermoautotrophica]
MPCGNSRPLLYGIEHLTALQDALWRFRGSVDTANAWGRELAEVLPAGGRLLVAGNGGSAAQAQHLAAELVGRYRDDRPPFSAIALHAETSSLTAIGNDYGYELVFARQVEAHGRPGDVLMLLSASGGSPNVIGAARVARRRGLTVWALTGPVPNPLAKLAHDAICVQAHATATIQEVHQVALHMVCAAMDVALGVAPPHAAEVPA